MAVWILDTEQDITSISFPLEEDKIFFQELVRDYFEASIRVSEQWHSLLMLSGEPKRFSDFLFIDDTNVIAISQRAVNSLNEVLNKVELLPIETDIGSYYAINVINVIDCLNKKKSKYSATDSGIIVTYSLLEFDEPKLEGNVIFKIPELPYVTFITNEILDLCTKSSLRGLEFDEKLNMVWCP